MTDAKRPLKLFLCHASADKPKVRELYRTLKRRGVQPWLDAEDLIPGQNWEVEIPKALLSSDAIIICLSPNSVDKEGYVQKEIKFALDKAMEMPEGRIFIIPARLEDCDLPFGLKKYQTVNLYEKAGYTKLMQALKLRASQLERAIVELPKKGETTAEIKKVVEEKKPPEPKEEKAEIKTPKPSQDKVGVGGDVSDSVIVSGSGNVINIGEQKKTEPEKQQPKKTKPSHKPNTAVIVALIGLAGTIIAALLGSPIVEEWFPLAPSATETITVTATLTSRPATPSPTVTFAPEPKFTIVDPQEVLEIAPSLRTLGQLAVEKYSTEERNRINSTLPFTVNSTTDVPILWRWFWCAVTDEVLEQNMTKISIIFDADGQVIPQEQLATVIFENSDPIYEGWKCRTYETVMRDWKPGTYVFTQTMTISQAINDGRETFEAGYKIYEYTVNISAE